MLLGFDRCRFLVGLAYELSVYHAEHPLLTSLPTHWSFTFFGWWREDSKAHLAEEAPRHLCTGMWDGAGQGSAQQDFSLPFGPEIQFHSISKQETSLYAKGVEL